MYIINLSFKFKASKQGRIQGGGAVLHPRPVKGGGVAPPKTQSLHFSNLKLKSKNPKHPK